MPHPYDQVETLSTALPWQFMEETHGNVIDRCRVKGVNRASDARCMFDTSTGTEPQDAAKRSTPFSKKYSQLPVASFRTVLFPPLVCSVQLWNAVR
jgi:hypothetical protein